MLRDSTPLPQLQGASHKADDTAGAWKQLLGQHRPQEVWAKPSHEKTKGCSFPGAILMVC